MTINPGTRVLTLAMLLCLPAMAALADKDKRELDGFHAIAVSGGIDLEIHRGDHYAVTVHTDSGDADQIETGVERQTLVIRKSSGFLGLFGWLGMFHWFEHYSVDVMLPRLEKVSASGGSDVAFDEDFAGDQLELNASGGCNVRFKGKLDSLVLTASGGSDAYLEGSAHRLEARVSGGSDLHASKFEVSEADIISSGGSDAVITVHDKLSVRASGGSDVRYGGHPQQTDIRSSGGSGVKARRDD